MAQSVAKKLFFVPELTVRLYFRALIMHARMTTQGTKGNKTSFFVVDGFTYQSIEGFTNLQ